MVRAAIAKGRITAADVVTMQADVTSLDGQFFTPVITNALDRARRSSTPELAALVRDPRVVEAVGRLARWNFTYPVGQSVLDLVGAIDSITLFVPAPRG